MGIHRKKEELSTNEWETKTEIFSDNIFRPAQADQKGRKIIGEKNCLPIEIEQKGLEKKKSAQDQAAMTFIGEKKSEGGKEIGEGYSGYEIKNG